MLEAELANEIFGGAKKHRNAQLVAVIEWAIARWRVLLADLLPDATRNLDKLKITTRPVMHRLPWLKPVRDVTDYDLSSRRFDLTQTLTPAAIAAAQAEITPALRDQLGATTLARVRMLPGVSELMQDALGVLRVALENTVELHALAHPNTVAQRVAALEPEATLLARLR